MQASGVMVHYLNGKPVKVVYSEAGNVIHVHRNCAEWYSVNTCVKNMSRFLISIS